MQALVRWFQEQGVPDYLYLIGGGLGYGECYGVEDTVAGWTVYYRERGTKSVISRHATEDEACKVLFDKVAKSFANVTGRALARPSPSPA